MNGEIEALGATLVAISPQTAEKSREMVERRKYAFPFLHDEGNAVAEAYGLRFRLPDALEQVYRKFGLDLEASNGETSWTLPMPARYVADGEGVVRYARVHPDYTRRPEPEETLEVLRQLRS